MKRHIRDDRRCDDRRQGDKRSDSDVLGGKRKAKRRGRKRRKFVRLAYPPTVTPTVLNANFRIVDISQEGIAFLCRENCEDCTKPITLKSILGLKIQFHDGEIIGIKVEILRCERHLHSRVKTYAGFVEKGISHERIATEQAYLLSKFPKFCRASSDLW